MIAPRTRRWLSATAVVVGVGWVIWLLLDQQVQPATFVPDRPAALGGATALLALATCLNAWIFVRLVGAHAPAPHGCAWLLVRVHVLGQVVRYLPGRFFGFLYQLSVAGERVSPAALTRANIDIALLSLAGNLGIPLVVLAFALSGRMDVALGGAAAVCVALALAGTAVRVAYRALPRLARRLPARAEAFVADVARSRLPAADRAGVILVYVVSWLIYLAAWQQLGEAYASLAGEDMLGLCAAYALAWLLGFLSGITPGGLGVREGAFVALGQTLADAGAVVLLAVLVRAWLTLADLLVAALLAPLALLMERTGR